ncbi:hypothetical protein K450DRAFT_263330 [Umbelopsis ramanniana AG]|uniref:Uncharacterized protein n=1 Tax=Umbelopsis ramanniana AG TaxID=1314678 RepID=A0AAD5E1J9_UMBRA|nr:uncharacterized protein K450DRAFT_263330 [Umbelopsis ramanniana AG]KAI8575094.1 hypothetical protein K450DRAFT_263330 [Umbelopsis ramanniana AG]
MYACDYFVSRRKGQSDRCPPIGPSTATRPGEQKLDVPKELKLDTQSQMTPPPTSTDYSLLSPNLSDILNDDQVLKFYQSVKDIKAQQSPTKTAAMFFAFCHALNQQTTFLKVPNLNRLLFRQDEKCYSVDVTGTGQDNVDALSDFCLDILRLDRSTANTILQDVMSLRPSEMTSKRHPSDKNAKREGSQFANGTVAKKPRKAGLQAKEYDERKLGMLNDLLRISDHDLKQLAKVVEDTVGKIIKGEVPDDEKDMDALAMFSKYANAAAHMETDFAPRNAGFYYNHEYFQLYQAYRKYEKEREQLNHAGASVDTRSISVQCRSELEKKLQTTNWEAIRRRLTIGERITALAQAIGPGYLLLSRQVSGRKLLHTFSTVEWVKFMNELSQPEHIEAVSTLKYRLAAENLYAPTM